MEAKPNPTVILRHQPKKETTQTSEEYVPRERDPKRGRLCVTRYDKSPKNTLFIGDVEIEILEIRSGQVRLGIYADRSIQIERKERLDAKKSQAS
jgi:sRNA-binding carbon storage regulator CsrA